MIDFCNVSKLLGNRDILNHASFSINNGEKIGIVGPNGSGKTTMFSLIMKEMSPDEGDIMLPEKLRIGILHQQLSLSGNSETLLEYVKAASGELPLVLERINLLEAVLKTNPQDEAALTELGRYQTIFEHLGGYSMEHLACSALAGLGFQKDDLQKQMCEFSGGWQMRAGMAKVLLGEPDILLLDEPSNYLDIPAVEWLQRRLKTFTGTLLLISHDRFLLNTLTNVTLELNGGKATRYNGNYNFYVKERENRYIQAESAQKNINKKKQKLEENINRFRAKATKASQVQSWIKMLDKIEDADLPEDLHFQGQIRIPDPPHCGNDVLSINHVSHTYDGIRWIFRDVSLSITKGEKIGIVGYNGTGKSTLLKIIAGRFQPTEGNVIPGHKVITGYQAQEFAELLPAEESAFDVVKSAAKNIDVGGQRIREILGAFGFSGESALKQCKVLSGGEKIRLCFARIFVNPPNFLILDEPTTHLDIAAREALQQAVQDYPGTVCLVSHDVEFLRNTVNEIIEMTHEHVRKFIGSFDYYLEKTAEENAQAAAPDNSSMKSNKSLEIPDNNSKERRREKARKRSEMLPEKRRLEKTVSALEKEIEKGEQEKAELLKSLTSMTGNVDYAGLQKRIKEIDYEISKATIEWEKNAQELEAFLKVYEEI